MGWLGDGSHRGQVCQAWTAVGLPPRYPHLRGRRMYEHRCRGYNSPLLYGFNWIIRKVTGRFAPCQSPPDVSAPKNVSPRGRIQRFLFIQLKPKHHRLDVLTTRVAVCVCYLLSYQGRNVLGAKCPGANWWRGKTLRKNAVSSKSKCVFFTFSTELNYFISAWCYYISEEYLTVFTPPRFTVLHTHLLCYVSK